MRKITFEGEQANSFPTTDFVYHEPSTGDSAQSMFRAVKAPRYRWKPQLDITTYELALCLTPLFTHDGAEVDRLPPEARRHFEEMK